jgi:sortase A
MIAAGVLILLFVAYQLWGTNIAEARSQRKLQRSFNSALAAPAPPVTTPVTTAGGGTTPPTQPPRDDNPPPAPNGGATAIIKIPDINLTKAVVEGVTVSDLKKGPGHYPKTPMPGQAGNAAIAGHRTTYGAPFGNLDQLNTGDPIFVTTRAGQFRYEVMEKKVVSPDTLEVLDPTPDNRLTLTTCHPKLSARQRLVVVARLIGTAAPAPPPAPAVTPPANGATPTTAATDPGSPTIDEPAGNLSGVRSAAAPAFLWGLLAALVALATYVLSRQWRRWPAYLIGAPVFLLVLFVFFENFSRLLPANI